MLGLYVTTLLVLVLFTPIGGSIRPKYIGCQDSSECLGEACCVLGMARFSIPICKAYQEINEACCPHNHRPINTTVSYLDGSVVDLTNVYKQSCQCAAGLTCSEQTSTCQDPSTDPNFNFLD